MSDDNGGADQGSDPSAGSEGGEIGSGGLEALPAETSVTGRLDSVHATLSTLGMRIDALVTSTTSYRSALTDRLTEYADLVSKLTRTQAADLEEYRRSNERAIADLRRSLTGTDDLMERVGARIDSLLTDSESADDTARRMLTEVRSILEAQESLSRFLTESLDQFGERVLSQIATSQSATLEQIEALRTSLEADPEADGEILASIAPLREGLDRIEVHLADSTRDERTADRLARIDERLNALAQIDPTAALAGRFDEVRESLTDVASGEVVGALWDEVHSMRGTLETAATGPSAAIETLRHELGRAADSLSELASRAASADAVEALRSEIGGIGVALDSLVLASQTDEPVDDGVAHLQSDVSALTAAVQTLIERADSADDAEPSAPHPVLVGLANDVGALRDELSRGLVVEPSDALAGTVDELRADLAALDGRMSALTDLQESVGVLRADGTLTAVAADLSALRARVEDTSAVRDDQLKTELQSEFASMRSQLVSLLDRAQPDTGDIDAADVEGELQVLRSGVEGLDAGMRAMRSGVEDIIARLDEGLVIDTELSAPAASAVPELADQLATMRDLVSTEFDDLRQLVGGIEVGAAPATTGEDPRTSLDPDTLDLLRDEIRSAGAVSDDLVEALRKELIALRRRIKLRAEGEILTAAQLEAIAEAVARRLAE